MSVHLWEENKGWVLGRTPDINPPACSTFWKVHTLVWLVLVAGTGAGFFFVLMGWTASSMGTLDDDGSGAQYFYNLFLRTFRAKRDITLIATRGMRLTRLCSHAPVSALLPTRVGQRASTCSLRGCEFLLSFSPSLPTFLASI